jgi:methylmalonyl-CoA mutase cobalamin-binding domain/chain
MENEASLRLAGGANTLTALMVNLQEGETLREVRGQLDAGVRPRAVLDSLNDGMTIIGQKYAAKEFFLTELVMAAEIFKGAMEILEPALHADGDGRRESLGTIVIGTVKGDLHDIGKNIFVGLARNAGFQVVDLGIDVPPETFVDQAKQCAADIVGLSGLLTMAIHPMQETVARLDTAGMREQVKVIIGGISVDRQWGEHVGADAFTDDAYEGLQMVKAFVGAA